MSNARHIGRIGALAVALSIGVGLAATHGRHYRAGERSGQREHLEGRRAEGAERYRRRATSRRRFIGES